MDKDKDSKVQDESLRKVREEADIKISKLIQ
jgi:hypothetical protein